MEIKIELDLPAIISAAVSAERVQPLLDKAIADSIKSAISDATGYRSAFNEALKKQLAEAMPKGLGIDDCAKFQHILNAAVTSAVHNENAQTIQAAMRAAVKAVMPDVLTKIKMSELVEAARGGFHKEEYEAFYARLEMSDYGGGTLFLDSDERTRERYSANIRLQFNKEGEVFALHLDGRDVTPSSTPTAVGSFNGLLLSMYVGRTSLELDCDEGDVADAATSRND